MAPLRTAATFSQVLKAPTTYMLMVAVSLLCYATVSYKDSSEERVKSLQAENMQLRTERERDRVERIAKEESIQKLMTALLVKNGIIEALKTRNTKDSLAAGEDNIQ